MIEQTPVKGDIFSVVERYKIEKRKGNYTIAIQLRRQLHEFISAKLALIDKVYKELTNV